jgi:8-oxo-dGTP pyrophosphatase MutT (NUDIX family)
VLKWQTIETKLLSRTPIFELRRQRSLHPRRGKRDFFVLKAPFWVNIIPLTPQGEVVMVRQYRHGVEAVTLEVPGGMVDQEDPNPLEAARREMCEETGYDSTELIELGSVHPNPAILDNLCFSFLARNVVRAGPKKLDSDEATRVVLYPLDRIPQLIAGGRITHALVIAAFHLLTIHDGNNRGRRGRRTKLQANSTSDT